VLQVAGEKGFPWTVEFTPGPADYSGLAARDLLHRIIAGELTPGPLVLLHFNAEHTAELVPQLVGVLRARGYKLVTVSQLIKGDDLYADVPPEAREAVARVVGVGLMDAPAGAFRPLEPMARIEVARILYRLAQVVAPRLVGQQGLPEWWGGPPVPPD
jgi:hypothetical protein